MAVTPSLARLRDPAMPSTELEALLANYSSISHVHLHAILENPSTPIHAVIPLLYKNLWFLLHLANNPALPLYDLEEPGIYARAMDYAERKKRERKERHR